MRLDIVLDDVTYTGKDEPDLEHVVQSDRFFAVLKRTASYQHHLKDGRVLLLGAIAIQRAHFLYCPSEKAGDKE